MSIFEGDHSYSLISFGRVQPALHQFAHSRLAWKKQVKRLYLTKEFLAFLDECDHLPLSLCSVGLGSPVNHWRVTLGLPILTRQNNFRLRLLVGCDGLEQDASRFRQRKDPSSRAHDASCKFCLTEPPHLFLGVLRLRQPASVITSGVHVTPLFEGVAAYHGYLVPRLGCSVPTLTVS